MKKPTKTINENRRKDFEEFKDWYKRNGNCLHYKFPIAKPR